ncbi:hypothetical protein Pcinc_040476 [Petrolisthes cinctipes]|uniref:Uncharacterized protein n=1 Tax=Petrolisthes cinctipes TaxID=88211 RepID=A0AAE1EHZ3_PETCI|nr:hypothetical protein Pcinc_040476 [Petrolisthes cinctipes]
MDSQPVDRGFVDIMKEEELERDGFALLGSLKKKMLESREKYCGEEEEEEEEEEEVVVVEEEEEEVVEEEEEEEDAERQEKDGNVVRFWERVMERY